MRFAPSSFYAGTMITAAENQNRGDALRIARLGAGLTQAAVAARVGISESALSRRENGTVAITDENFAAIIRAITDLISTRHDTRGAAA